MISLIAIYVIGIIVFTIVLQCNEHEPNFEAIVQWPILMIQLMFEIVFKRNNNEHETL